MAVNTEATASTSRSIKTQSDSFSRKTSCKTYAVKPTKDLPADVIAMRAFAAKVNSRSIEDFKRVFKKIQRRGAFADKLTYDAQKQNAKKCRYDNVICLDHNRVILKSMPPFNGDFIHANWISSEFLSRKFICAQGPMENTIVDFWRMIWQEHIELIIMLCKLVEDGKEKCAPYWPSKAGEKKNFSGFTITSTKIESRDEVTLTILSLTYSEETRRLRHFQWTSWPDCDAPRHLITPYTLHGISRTVEGPTVVHCSAGIGRSGTFIMLEIVYRCLRAGNITSVYSLLLQLRSQRAGSVQTFDQFLYIFYATIQRLINRGAVDSTTVTNFCTIYETRFKTKTGQIPIQWPIPKRRILVEKRSHYRRHKQMNEVQIRKCSEDAAKRLSSVTPTASTAKSISLDRITIALPSNEEFRQAMSNESTTFNCLSRKTLSDAPNIVDPTTTKSEMAMGSGVGVTLHAVSPIRSQSCVTFGYLPPEYSMEAIMAKHESTTVTHRCDLDSIAMDMEKFDLKSSPRCKHLKDNSGTNATSTSLQANEAIEHMQEDIPDEHFFPGVSTIPNSKVSVYLPLPSMK